MAQALHPGAAPTASPVASPVAASALGGALASTMAAGAASSPSPAPGAADPAEEIVATLEKLHGLVAKGILTQDEFNAKKAELLSKLV